MSVRTGRLRRWVGGVAVLAVTATGVVAAVPGPAYANLPNGCPDASTAGHFQTTLPFFRFKNDGHAHRALLVFWIESVTPTFNAADSRVAVNDLPTPVTVTFTSQQSQTFTITQSRTTNISTPVLSSTFSTTVSASVTISQTTQIGVSVTAQVPAFGRVQGDYGVEAFNVQWTVDAYEIGSNFERGGRCWYHYSDRHVVSNVPTTVEGWRLHT